MCDYSLLHLKSTTAWAGQTLTTHHFGSTRGFKAASDTGTGDKAAPVCVLPGAEIAFNKAPVEVVEATTKTAEVDGERRTIGGKPPTEQRVATLIQVDKASPTSHHDALQFADGTIVLLHSLKDGQEATVVTMPAEPVTDKEREAQRRVEFV